MLDDWADPLTIEVIDATDLLKSFEAVYVSIEDLGCTAFSVGP